MSLSLFGVRSRNLHCDRKGAVSLCVRDLKSVVFLFVHMVGNALSEVANLKNYSISHLCMACSPDCCSVWVFQKQKFRRVNKEFAFLFGVDVRNDVVVVLCGCRKMVCFLRCAN